MLYDILIIDDDFGSESDSSDWKTDANKLFLEFIRDNLRVTHTTGELEDIGQLKNADLSCIKYIFCDLHLTGITGNDDYKSINSKLIGIIHELDQHIKSGSITLFINSRFANQRYGTEGSKHLEKALEDNYKKKFQLKPLEIKNMLSESEKKSLMKNNIQIYSKQLIIDKTIEIEKEFDSQLKLSNKAKERLSFENKFYVFQSQFDIDDGGIKKQIQLLKEIRNKIAHTENALDKIKGDAERKTFNEIISSEETENAIEFKTMKVLFDYIASIDALGTLINTATKKS